MSFSSGLTAFLQYLLLAPAALFCALPLEKRFCYPLRRVYGTVFGGCLLLAGLATFLDASGIWLSPGLPILAAVAAWLLCLKATDIKPIRLWNLFVNAVAFFSFPGFASYLTESRVQPGGTWLDPTTPYGVAVQWALSLALLAAMRRPLKGQIAWLLFHYNEDHVWRISWIIPAMVAACTLFMIPKSYATMQVGRVFRVTVVIISVIFVMLVIFNLLFYYMARRSVQRVELERRADLLEIQASQYARLKDRMEATAQQRHDFRHSIRLMDELARKGDLEGLRRYVSEYSAKLEEAPLESYCANAAVNALLGYYAAMGREAGVRVRLQIALPKNLPVDEVDLCSLLGNLMENAIEACRAVPAPARYVAVSAEIQGERLYIVSTNSFNGELKMRNGRFFSTTHSGAGMGLRSIKAIAERYGGALRVYPSGTTFCVDVYLRGERTGDGDEGRWEALPPKPTA